MSTRGNYVFAEYPYKKDDDGDYRLDPEQIVNLKKGISNETEVIKNGYKIYVHWDNYPSGALPRLLQFLELKGAKARAGDLPYLAAWFVTYNCCLNSHWELEPCDIAAKNDFTGIGLETKLNDWCDYTYVIVPDITIKENGYIKKQNGFRIFIFDYKFDFIEEIHSTDDIEEYETAEWWY